MMVTKQALYVAEHVRSLQLQYALSEALAEGDGTELDLRIGGLKRGPRSAARRKAPGVLLLEIDVDDVQDMAALGQLSIEASRAHVPIVATARI